MPQALAWNMGTMQSDAVVDADADAPWRADGERMQVNGSMTVHDALGIARGSGGVAHGGGGALVEIGPREFRLLGGEEVLVAQKVFGQAGCIADDDDVLDGAKVFRDARDRGIERCVDEDDAVCAVIDDEGELFREEADVERVHDRAHRRDGVVGFEVLLSVPAEGSDAIAGADAETLERTGEAANAIAHFAEGGAAGVIAHPCKDFALAVDSDAMLEDRADGELKVRHRGQHGKHAWDLRGMARQFYRSKYGRFKTKPRAGMRRRARYRGPWT